MLLLEDSASWNLIDDGIRHHSDSYHLNLLFLGIANLASKAINIPQGQYTIDLS